VRPSLPLKFPRMNSVCSTGSSSEPEEAARFARLQLGAIGFAAGRVRESARLESKMDSRRITSRPPRIFQAVSLPTPLLDGLELLGSESCSRSDGLASLRGTIARGQCGKSFKNICMADSRGQILRGRISRDRSRAALGQTTKKASKCEVNQFGARRIAERIHSCTTNDAGRERTALPARG